MLKDRAFHSEHVNDRWKLMMHRVIARELSMNPDRVIGDGLRWIVRMKDEGRFIEVHSHWENLLNEAPETVRRNITKRTDYMNWMRRSSPLRSKMMNDVSFRQRTYQLSKKGLILRQSILMKEEKYDEWQGATHNR